MKQPILTPSLRERLWLSVTSFLLMCPAFWLVGTTLQYLLGDTEQFAFTSAVFWLGILHSSGFILLQEWGSHRLLQREPEDLQEKELVREKAKVWWQAGEQSYSGLLVVTNQRLIFQPFGKAWISETCLDRVKLLASKKHPLPSWRLTQLQLSGQNVWIRGWAPRAAEWKVETKSTVSSAASLW